MPAKKKTAKKAPTKKTSSKRSAPTTYECPNPGPQYNLTEIVNKMLDDESFAKFIKKLLCKMLGGTSAERDEASDCLDSYFAPTSGELDKLCITEEDQDRINDTGCTDRTTLAYLLDVPAYITVNLRNRIR